MNLTRELIIYKFKFQQNFLIIYEVKNYFLSKFRLLYFNYVYHISY